jgi:hypothetical protein
MQFICVACLLIAGPARDHADKDEYEFVQDTDRLVGILRGKWMIIGRLDKNGNFIPKADGSFQVLRKDQPASSIDPFEIINSRVERRETVLEFRSGSLIKGVLETDGNFVPDLNSKVLAFKDYHYSEDSIRIYNLPGSFVKKKRDKTTKD